MITIGEYNTLEIVRETSVGLYLEDEEGNDVLLPFRYMPDEYDLGDEISVFIYKDNEDRIIATSEKPLITLNHFAFLKVRTVNHLGAFMETGYMKDLFVPFREQSGELLEGRKYLTYMYLDDKTDRLTGSTHPQRFLSNTDLTVEVDDEVELFVWDRTDLGFNVIINHLHKGLIYHNEIFTPIQYGDSLKGYVKKIREDNKVDIALQKAGFRHVDENVNKLLDVLQQENGFLPLNDKSDPKDIYRKLEMSKKTFKKAVGALYKARKIKLEKEGIYLLNQ